MVSEAELDQIRAAMRNVKVAGAYDKVYNDECMLSFDTPFSSDGLYVSLSTFQGFGKPYVTSDHERTGNELYVHIKSKRVPKPQDATATAETAAPSRMALGGEGGFQLDEEKFEVVSESAVVLLPSWLSVPLPCEALPEFVSNAARAVLNHSSCLQESQAAAVAWEAEQVRPSKYAKDLVQLPAHKKISPDPSTWVCEESGMRENLWLNLSDGHIGSGRKQWDGSGGTNGALNHYLETKLHFPPSGFPLVVKLGTITPHGADVYSYATDEDTEVSDPKLAEHLAHWGINMLQMEKTVDSVVEMNIKANEKLELDKITEAGKELQPLSGRGYVGLSNLGNSCYMNSVLQLLFSMEEFHVFASASASVFKGVAEPAQDLFCQLSKLANGLLSEQLPAEEECSVTPRMLKLLVGKNHPEFSSPRQQDAQEYLQHFLSLLERAERTGGARLGDEADTLPLSSLFSFGFEERIEADGQVLYRSVPGQRQLSLGIPLEASVNKEEVAAYEQRMQGGEGAEGVAPMTTDEEAAVPLVPLEACLAQLTSVEPLDNFRGRSATKSTRFKTFPRYLLVHLRRYYVASDWTAKKLRVRVQVPETLDLSELRSAGLQPHEQPLPDEEEATASTANATQGGATEAPQPDETLVAQLVSMGFSENGCRRAVLAVNNSNADAAMEWVFAHMEDADFNDPLPPPGATAPAAPAAAAEADADAMAMLSSMGFTQTQAKGALAATSGNVERAADWLFSHADDLDSAVSRALGEVEVAVDACANGAVAEQGEDGPGVYELFGFVSHMGANTSCGHYVCHVKKDGRWALFNDRKVAASEETPLESGYMYFYKRKA